MNQSNIIPDGNNNKLKYNFPNSVSLKDKYIAVSSISMYYSWFNITQVYSNNYFTYSWISGAGNTITVYTINIPDGLYQISDLNNLIQYACIANGTYFLNTNGTNSYPFEFILNAPRYAVQINTYLWPTSLPTGASLPSNYPSSGVLATESFNSIVTIPAKLNIIVGYNAGFATANNINNSYSPSGQYESKSSIGTLSYISSQAPQVQPNNSVTFSISGINNPYTQPSSIIYSLNPNVLVGQQIFETPPNYSWSKFIDGTYSSLTLTLLGNDLQPLIIKDPNMTFLFVLRDKDEAFLGSK